MDSPSQPVSSVTKLYIPLEAGSLWHVFQVPEELKVPIISTHSKKRRIITNDGVNDLLTVPPHFVMRVYHSPRFLAFFGDELDSRNKIVALPNLRTTDKTASSTIYPPSAHHELIACAWCFNSHLAYRSSTTPTTSLYFDCLFNYTWNDDYLGSLWGEYYSMQLGEERLLGRSIKDSMDCVKDRLRDVEHIGGVHIDASLE